jgi:hypothetical protein
MTKQLARIFIFALLGVCISTSGFAQVSGSLKGNGVEGKLAFAKAVKGEPFSGEETVKVVLTEKDAGADDKPDFNAMFGKYGNAMIVTVSKTGNIYGTEVSHASHSRKPFSSVGTLKITDFHWDATGVSGKLSTGGPATFFDDTWEVVDLTFKAPVQQSR